MQPRELTPDEILSTRPSVPEHVVYREFVSETVVLNLETGAYHGLNPSGAKMLDTLREAATVAEAADALSEHFGRPLPEIQTDLSAFCLELNDRGLLELEYEAKALE
jgi:hypothetical protein